MFEKKYKTKNLAIARLSLLHNREYTFKEVIEHCEQLDGFFIVKKVTKDYENLYKDIFTGTKIQTLNSLLRNGEMFLKRTYSIDEYLTDAELSTGKITKSRLIEIYRMLNKREDKYDDNYENYQDGTNGKVIKFARKCNKK